jgi:hypothetical protein
MIAVRVVRDGVIVREEVHRALPVRIGRGPENELVLLDESVSRAHAAVDRDPDGTLVLRDLTSRNGLRQGALRVERLRLAGSQRVHVGGVELEIFVPSADDTQEIRPEDAPERRRTFRHHLGYLLVGTMGWLAYAVTRVELWSPWEKNRAGDVLTQALAALFLQPIAAFLLLVLLRAAGRRVRISDTLRAVARILWAFPLQALATMVAYYVLSPGMLSRVDGWLSSIVTIVIVVTLASVGRRGPSGGFRIAWAATLALLMVGLHAVGSIAARREGQPQTLYHVQIPLAGRTGPTASLDTYLKDLRQASADAAGQAEGVRRKQE